MTTSHPCWQLSPPTGELLLTPCPSTKNFNLQSSLSDLKASGAKAIITLMPMQEMQFNQVKLLKRLYHHV